MQICDSYNQKNSLFNAMNRFIGAVSNMDQTIMVPSLLRDVPFDQEGEKEANSLQDRDMYGSYVLLKSIRNDIEWGVLQADERRKEKLGVTTALEMSRIEPSDEGLGEAVSYSSKRTAHGSGKVHPKSKHLNKQIQARNWYRWLRELK